MADPEFLTARDAILARVQFSDKLGTQAQRHLAVSTEQLLSQLNVAWPATPNARPLDAPDAAARSKWRASSEPIALAGSPAEWTPLPPAMASVAATGVQATGGHAIPPNHVSLSLASSARQSASSAAHADARPSFGLSEPNGNVFPGRAPVDALDHTSNDAAGRLATNEDAPLNGGEALPAAAFQDPNGQPPTAGTAQLLDTVLEKVQASLEDLVTRRLSEERLIAYQREVQRRAILRK